MKHTPTQQVAHIEGWLKKLDGIAQQSKGAKLAQVNLDADYLRDFLEYAKAELKQKEVA